MLPTSISITTHRVFIADEQGMNDSFPQIKALLKDTACDVSLIYISFNEKYIFQRELDILCRHYPNRLLVYFENITATIEDFIENQTLEAIINCNTSDEMCFFIMTDEDGIYSIKKYLVFLGIEEKNIRLSFFNID